MHDWDALCTNWKKTLEAVDRLGGITTGFAARSAGIQHSEFWGLHIEPPALASELTAVETELGLRLPEKLREIFTKLAGRIDFRWQLSDDLEFSEPFGGIFSGGFSLNLLEIPEIHEEMMGMASVFEEASEFDITWHDKLAFMRGYPGNYYVFDAKDRVGDAVIYLNHEDDEAHGYTLGSDIVDFLKRWSALGTPGPEHWQWFPFATSPSSLLQTESEIAKKWREQLGLELNS